MRIAGGVLNRADSPARVGPYVGSVFALIALAAVVTPFLSGETAGVVGASGMAIGASAAGILLIRKARTLSRDERPAWSWLGYGLLLIAAGIAAVSVAVGTTGYTAAFGMPDLLFLAGYSVGMAGLARLPHATGTLLQRFRLLLDGIIGAVALIALFWVLFYAQVIDALASSPAWERIVGSSYPLFDLLLLVTAMIVIVRRSVYRYDLRLVFLVIGILAQAGADVAFFLRGVGRSFIDAQPIFPLHLLAIAAFLATAVVVDRPIETREYADRPSTPLWAMFLPYGTAALMIVVLVTRVGWTTLTSDDTVLQAATLLVGILVIIRQGVAIRENRQFVERQSSVLVSSISHELRTPLTAMVGFLQLLDSGEITNPSEYAEMLSIVNQQAAHLSGIVSDLTMLASDQITAMDLNVAGTPIDELAWGSVNSAPIDPTEVRVEADGNVIAFVDRVRINQATGNFLSNAIRYGGGEVHLTISAAGGDLIIEVHDNGPGVPPKYELIIWERFERGNNRLNATVPGSGIGLAVTNAIAKAHGGSAGYRRSELLGGACFWIRLPGRVRLDREQERYRPMRTPTGDARTA